MMRCTCCGNWTVEVVEHFDGPRYRLRSPWRIRDYRRWQEVAAELNEAGALEHMEDVE